MKRFALLPVVALALAGAACTTAPNASPTATTAPTTAPPATATPTSAPTSSSVPTSAAPTGTASVAPSPSAPTGTCSVLLEAGDLAIGIVDTETRELSAAGMQPGFIGGEGIDFTLFNSDSVGSTLACFDTPAHAAAQYGVWGTDCEIPGLPSTPAVDVPLGATIGDASKGVFCAARASGSTSVAASTSVYVQSGATVFSITYNSKTATGPASVELLVSAAQAVANRL